jgi:hypothetical protein
MAGFAYKGKHKEKLKELAPATQESRETYKGSALFPPLPRPGPRDDRRVMLSEAKP